MLFIYTRCSTTEQANGSTLEDQEAKCRAIATLRGQTSHDVAVFSDPGISGSVPLSDRPKGSELLSLMAKGDIVVAAKLDRLFRSARDALTVVEDLASRGIGVLLADIGTEPVTENGVAKMFFTMLAAFAEFERGRINERTNEGRKAKLAKDGYMGGAAPPYGFKVIGQGRDARLEPVAEEMEVIRLAQELAVQKLKPMQIIRSLSDRGIRARNGKPLHHMQVVRMIQRPSIGGEQQLG